MTLSIEVPSQGILGRITADYHMQRHKNNCFPASEQIPSLARNPPIPPFPKLVVSHT